MNQEELQELANEAFAAIERKAGKTFPHSTIAEAYESFQQIGKSNGPRWIMDAIAGTTISSTRYCEWMSKAKELLT